MWGFGFSNKKYANNIPDLSDRHDQRAAAENKEYMYCRKCGNMIGNDAAFCVYCGTKMIQEESEQAKAQQAQDAWREQMKQRIADRESEERRLRGYASQPRQQTKEMQGKQKCYCRYCGAKIETDSVFCAKCGARTSDDKQIGIAVQVPAVIQKNNQTYQQRAEVKCQRCGGEVSFQTVTESNEGGCFTVIWYVILTLTIFGLLIVIPLMLRKKTKTVTYAVCQKCGHRTRCRDESLFWDWQATTRMQSGTNAVDVLMVLVFAFLCICLLIVALKANFAW